MVHHRQRAGRTSPSGWSTAAHFLRTSSSPSCSATRRGPSPGPSTGGWASSRRPGRHGLPRRDRRAPPGAAAQAAPGTRGAGDPPARHQPPRSGGRADHRRHQPRSARRGERRPLPLRPLLPPRGGEDSPSPAPPAPRRHPAHRGEAPQRARLGCAGEGRACSTPRSWPSCSARPGRATSASSGTTSSGVWSSRRCSSLRRRAVPGAARRRGCEHPVLRGSPRLLDTFERRYVQALLQLHGGKVSAAAASAQVDRVHLHRLIRRHRLKD